MKVRGRAPETIAAAVFAALVVGYAVRLAFFQNGPVGPRVGYGPDSQVYIDAAREPLWTLDFLAARGPFLFLLLAKFCARNLRAIVLVQSLVYAGAWIFLAYTVRALVRHRYVRLLAFVAILLTGLAPSVIQWNAIVSTESLAVSVLCVLVALALRLAAAPGRNTVVMFVAGLAAFAFVRDTNALVGLTIGAGAIVLALVRPSWRHAATVVAVACLAFGGIALALSSASDPPRWYYPLHETIALRLVGDETAESYFVARGLPLDEHLLALGDAYFLVVTRLDEGEEFAPLREWVREKGRSTYTAFLVTHPWWTLSKPVGDYERFLTPNLLNYRKLHRIEPPTIYRIAAFGYPEQHQLVAIWAILASAALVVAAVQAGARRPVVLTVAVVAVLAIAGFYAAWHGDALEVDRHSLSAAVQLRIAVWIATVLIVDIAVSQVKHAREAEDDDREDERLRADEQRPDPVDFAG